MAVAQLKTRRHGPEVLAKEDGPCKGCDKRIEAGEHYVCVVEGVGAMHALCARGYCQVLEEHAEDPDETGSSAGEGDE